MGATQNSDVITVPSRFKTVSVKGQRDDLQVLSISAEGRDPGSSLYPTSPTTTSNLLRLSLNDPFTPVAGTFTSKSVNGFSATGNWLFDSMNFEVADDQMVKTNYTWVSTGTITASAT